MATLAIADEALLTEKSIIDSGRAATARNRRRSDVDGIIIGGGDCQPQILGHSHPRLLPETIIRLTARGPGAEPSTKTRLQAVAGSW
jgi:hypothetical protein